MPLAQSLLRDSIIFARVSVSVPVCERWSCDCRRFDGSDSASEAVQWPMGSPSAARSEVRAKGPDLEVYHARAWAREARCYENRRENQRPA